MTRTVTVTEAVYRQLRVGVMCEDGFCERKHHLLRVSWSSLRYFFCPRQWGVLSKGESETAFGHPPKLLFNLAKAPSSKDAPQSRILAHLPAMVVPSLSRKSRFWYYPHATI